MSERRAARATAAALVAVTALSSVAGHAEQLLAVSPLVHGSLASSTPFTVPAAGTVTVTLTDLNWTASLASLTFAATTPTAVVASLASAGQTSFNVGSSGLYDAVVDAVASPQALLNLGQYSLVIDFTAAVPLPPTALLLLSALGCLMLARLQRRGAKPALRGARRVLVDMGLEV